MRHLVEVAVSGVLLKKVFLKISESSQKNTLGLKLY